MVDPDLERLIVRHLDGETAPDEELDLQREIVRNVSARQMLEDYTKVDRLGATALQYAWANREAPHVPTATGVMRPHTTHRWSQSWRWLVPGAIAAALLALVIPHPELGVPKSGAIVSSDRVTSSPAIGPRAPMGAATAPVRNVANEQPRLRRMTGRDIFGVLGEDGNLYWIEVDRTRTIRRQPALPQSPSSQEPL